MSKRKLDRETGYESDNDEPEPEPLAVNSASDPGPINLDQGIFMCNELRLLLEASEGSEECLQSLDNIQHFICSQVKANNRKKALLEKQNKTTCHDETEFNQSEMADSLCSELAITLQNSESAILFCQEKKLLAECQSCDKCGCNCYLRYKSKLMRQFVWRCSNTRCRSLISMRRGSIFDRSKMELSKILKFIYLWSYNMATHRNVQHECGIKGTTTVVEWKHLLRDICGEHLIRNSHKIGGPGHTIEIAESRLNRHKYNVGGVEEQVYVFGGYDPSDKECFLVTVPIRNAVALLPIIKEYVLPGTTIVSDCWETYNTSKEDGFRDLAVNHSLNFVDTDSKATTNHAEMTWAIAKERNKKIYGNKGMIDTCLTEFMWRQKFGNDPFQSILSQIASVYSFV